MSSPVFPSAHELSCPNCGAPCTLPAFGNVIRCDHCGTRFVMPGAQMSNAPPMETLSVAPTLSPEMQANVQRWIKWLVLCIVVVTVVPIVCGILASICGVFGAFVPFFVK
jgi:DNA-directed RNA polymerase subunit RPC12/RpoP